MIAFANQNALLLLIFEDSKYFEKHMERNFARLWRHQNINNRVLKLLEKELSLDISKENWPKFTVPVNLQVQIFRKKVGKSLQNISFGVQKLSISSRCYETPKIGKSSCQCQF